MVREYFLGWVCCLQFQEGRVCVCVRAHAVLENTLGLVFYNEHPSLPTEIKGNYDDLATFWKQLSSLVPQITPPLGFSRVTRSPDVSLYYNTLDMELSREETKEPVNLQEFFSPG